MGIDRIVMYQLNGRMPIYEYEAKSNREACPHCRDGFERMQRLSDAPLVSCPACGAAIRKRISAPSLGASQSGFDDRAKSSGFHKLQKLGNGEYEKKY